MDHATDKITVTMTFDEIEQLSRAGRAVEHSEASNRLTFLETSFRSEHSCRRIALSLLTTVMPAECASVEVQLGGRARARLVGEDGYALHWRGPDKACAVEQWSHDGETWTASLSAAQRRLQLDARPVALPNPSPAATPEPSHDDWETAAYLVHQAMRFEREGVTAAWQGGNSEAEEHARRAATAVYRVLLGRGGGRVAGPNGGGAPCG